MGRLALLPHYREVEHLVGGGMESWAVSTQPDGWQISGGANGTVNKDTVDPFAELASARIDKTLSGAIYLFQNPRAPVFPGMYYRIAAARRPSASGAPAIAAGRFVNITRNQCLTQTGTWTPGSTTNWTAPPAGKWFLQRTWIQIPSTFADGDVYEYRAGNFAASTGFSTWLDSLSLIGPYVRPIHITGLAPLTYAALARKEIVVILTSPTGLEIDITRRVQLDGLGTITEGAEEEMLRLTHGDMTLTLDDRDGLLRGLFQDATATDRWELTVLTETGRTHGLKWDRLFAGVLDLPWSVSFNPRESETKIQVFSYSKELELKSAETVKRTLASKTASITAATAQLVFLSGEAADLEIGDKVKLNDGTNTEEFTVTRKIDASNVVTSAPANRTFTSELAMVTTPFYHDRGPYNLLDLLATDAGADFNVLNPKQPVADFPVATPLSIADLNVGGVPMSLVPSSGSIIATFQAAYGTKRKVQASPTAPWTDGAISNSAQLDWTPYTDTDPGTLLVPTGTGADTGVSAADYVHGFFWNIVAQGSGTFTLHLFKSGIDLGAVSPALAGFSSVSGNGWWSQDYDPTFDGVFLSYNDNAGTRAIKYYSVFGGNLISVSTTKSGRVRAVRYGAGVVHVLVDDTAGTIEFWDTSVLVLRHSIAWSPDDFILTHTMRTWGNTSFGGAASKLWFTFLFERNNETWLAVFDARGPYTRWKIAATYRVSGTVSDSLNGVSFNQKRRRAYQTILNPGGADPVAVIYAGGEWLVLATYYAGVIRYADFTGLSCAGAIKELALITNSYFDADRYRSFNLTPRPSLLSAQAVQQIEDPLDRTSLPIWEFYRTACKVTGTDASGKGFTVIQGVDGGSAKTIEVSSPLITTPGMALAVATFYSAYLNRVVRQENIRIDEPEEPIRVLDIVDFDDAKWLVTDVQSNTKDREQTLRLFEVR